MKFAVFFLIAGFCMVAVNAATINNFEQGLFNQNDIELFINNLPEEPVEIQGQIINIFGKFFWVIWKALRAVKGVNCAIKNAMHIKREAIRFPVKVFECKVPFTDAVTNVIKSMSEVEASADNIIHLNSKVCNRETPSDNGIGDYEEIDGQTFGFFSCTFKLIKAFDALEHQLVATAKLINALPDAAFKVGGCMGDETKNLLTTFTDFPANVTICSKLN